MNGSEINWQLLSEDYNAWSIDHPLNHVNPLQNLKLKDLSCD